ncbi:ricin-type beta-trefoil lectin domain protein [Streptomyces sp. NPDC096132]|uniref:ricin-type beta-trefoil lectin domain protein n=1 Tax=Streptomyces sp. NPDC096132 TaxID=3366075 RepID=UPI00381B4BE4
MHGCNGAANQNWTLTGGGELRGYGDQCREAYGQGTANGTKLGIYTCNGGAHEKWTLTESGAIAGLQSGRCVDVSNEATAGGSPLALYDCNGQANQKWTRGSPPPRRWRGSPPPPAGLSDAASAGQPDTPMTPAQGRGRRHGRPTPPGRRLPGSASGPRPRPWAGPPPLDSPAAFPRGAQS